MDIELLRTFLEVQRTRHFGQAADHLCVTQAAVSARIRQLESLLNAELFIRERNNLRLTSTGERLMQYAETVVNTWQAARHDIALGNKQRQMISIGATAVLWESGLQAMLPRWYRALDNMSARAYVLTSDVLAKQLLQRRLDIAVCAAPLALPDVQIQSLGDIELTMVADQAYSSEQLKTVPSVVVDWGAHPHMQQATAEVAGPTQLVASNHQIGLTFLQAQGGCAYMPTGLVQAALQQGWLQVIDTVPVICKDVYLAYQSALEPHKQVLVQSMVEQALTEWRQLNR